jgi:hypothetical protein
MELPDNVLAFAFLFFISQKTGAKAPQHTLKRIAEFYIMIMLFVITLAYSNMRFIRIQEKFVKSS